MSILPIFSAELPNAKFSVQLLTSFHEPAAIFNKNCDLKFANPEWRISIKDGNFADIFEKTEPEVLFRLLKAIKRNKSITEKNEEFTLQITPLGPDSLVRCMPLATPPKVEIPETKPEPLISTPIPIEPNIEKIQTDPNVSKANLNTLIRGAPFGIARLNKCDLDDAQIIGTNPAFERIANVKSGVAIKSIVAEKDLHNFKELKIGAIGPIEIGMAHNENTLCEVWALEDGEKGAALVLVDITDRREMETRLNHLARVQTIGTIASEMAHELNNQLGAINVSCDLLLTRHTIGDPSYNDLQTIKYVNSRAAAQVFKLLAYGRMQTLRREVLDVGAVLTESEVLLRQSLDERVRLEIHHGRDLPNIYADKLQLETMLLNVVTNARDAIKSSEKGHGKIRIATKAISHEELKEALAKTSVNEIPDGNFCRISISDDGTGMSEETAARIFERYFTTKEVGKGSGHGMATVYGIVKQSGGFITLDTKLGEGTTFHVFIPTTDAELAKEKKIDTKTPIKRARNLSGQGKILLVEDLDPLRNSVELALKSRGYNVKSACDGEEALEILEENPNGFDLIITDVVMPGISGPVMLEQGKEFIGDAAIIFMSGFAEQDFSKILEEDPRISFLPKPFDLSQLAEAVKEKLTG